ncbi:MAG: carboxypeptidase regulatory-like domain-containing protein [Lachnospiraceae bacterium]|nr:carboxypeptidase regulatory-like domain-containing protein [Lachnospiraceae bacterium]
MKKKFLPLLLAAALTLQSVTAVPVYGAQNVIVSDNVYDAEIDAASELNANDVSEVSTNSVTILAKEKVNLNELFFSGESVSKFSLQDKSQKKIARLTKKGIITGKKSGEVVVNAAVGDSVKTCTVKVIKPNKTKRLKLKKNSQLDLSEILGISDNSLSAEWKVKTSKKTPDIVKFKKSGDDKLIIKDNGSAKITGTFGEKGKNGVVKPGKVSVSLKSKGVESYIDVSIANEDVYDEAYETQDEKITVKGDVSAESKVKSISAVINSYGVSGNSVSVNGSDEFEIPSAALETGSNTLTIKATLENGENITRDVELERFSKNLDMTENVKAIDSESDIKKISESIVDVWMDDKETEDTTDDEIHIAVSENSILHKYAKTGKINEGDVVYIESDDYFTGGLSLVYLGHDDNYPVDHLCDPDECEAIIMRQPDLADVFDDDIMMDYDSVEKADFVMVPKGTEVADINGNFEILTAESTFSNNEMEIESSGKSTDNDYVKNAGIQWQNFVKIIDPSGIDLSDGIKLNFRDVVLYDRDGDPNGNSENDEGKTDYDRLTLTGSLGMTDIDPRFGIEWHPIRYAEALPQQMMCKLDYKLQKELKVELGSELGSLSDIVENFSKKSGTDNLKYNLFGYEISGVDYGNTIVLGAVGFKLVSKHPVTGTIKSISNESKKIKLDPMVVVLLCMDVEGNIEAKTTFTYTNSTSYTKGINVQKDGFEGKYGSSYENKRLADTYTKIGDHDVDIYDSKSTAVSKLEIEGEGSAKASLGVGPAVGFMVAGIIPAQLKGTVGLDAKTNIDGKLTLETGKKAIVEGSAEANAKLLLKGAVDLRLAAKKKTEKSIEYHKDIDYTLLEWNKSTRNKTGTVYEVDYDDDSTNNPVIEGAEVVFERKNGAGGDKKTTTDSSGKFSVSNLSDADYKLTIKKDGYVTYVDDDFNADKVAEISKLKIYLDKDVEKCSLKGRICELDSDNDDSNNAPLDLAEVKLSKVNSSTTSDRSRTTDDNGAYEFDDLLPGLYKLTVKKVGYKTLECEVVIHEGDTAIQNYRLEAAPNDLAGNGYAMGAVYDALTGRRIEGGLKLSVVEGYNASNGVVIKTIDLNDDGTYSLYLPAGGYTVLVTDPRTGDEKKYYSGQFNIKVLGSKKYTNQNGTVTPVLQGDEIRIVLQWGQTPRDLDSHLNGPTPDGQRFHTYYSGKRYSYDGEKYADLDVDDTSSYGPETTTIYKKVDGKYKFSVHDYTNRSSSDSMKLADSGAYVTIYKAGFAEPKVFNVPYEEGTVWDVFEYDSESDTITVLDRMYYESNPGNVGVSEDSETETVGTSFISSVDESEEDGEKISGDEAVVY